MEVFCRGCLLQFNETNDLSPYSEKNRRLFVYSTGLQVKRNDTFTFQLCKVCQYAMKQACKFKKQCRASDKKYKNYLLTKEDGDGDFGHYIKSMDDNSIFRLPDAGHSTPAYQKNRDDDNESTCTSICNFMSDMLGEGMPSTDRPLPRIIREVIEEETDLCDDSLDSLWLQDDPSSDYNMDYSSFSPFATPRPIRGDHYYTPKRLEEAKVCEINYITSKEIIEKINIPQRTQFDMPSLEANEFDDNAEADSIKTEKYGEEENIPQLALYSSIPSEVEDLVTENSISNKLSMQTDILAKQMENNDTADFEPLSVKSEDLDIVEDVCIVLNQGTAKGNEDTLHNELECYVNKAETKKITRNLSMKDKSKDTIDRNLEIALKTTAGTHSSLYQLLTSPQVSVPSSTSTPTIRNILFGDQNENDKVNQSCASTPTIKNILFGKDLCMEMTQIGPKYFPQVGQCIEDTDDVAPADNILYNEFLKNNSEEDIKDEIEEMECDSIKSEECNEVLDKFLKDSDGPLPEGEVLSLFDQSVDGDKDVLNQPASPIEKFDLEKCLCKLCNKTYKTAKSLKIHLTKCHNYTIPSSDPHRNKNRKLIEHVCEICAKRIKTTSSFIKHKKSHEAKKNSDQVFQCDLCRLIFCTRSGIQSHILRVHKGILKKKHTKKFTCSFCGKLSSTKAHLKLHEMRHTGQFKMSCTICNKGFYRDYDLELHMRTHNGLHPFPCEYCPNKYKRRDTLYRHMMKHMGKDIYKCNVCDDASFVTYKSLIKHYKSDKCFANRQLSSKSKEKLVNKTIEDHFANNETVESQMDDQSENNGTIKSQMSVQSENNYRIRKQ